MLKQLVSLRSSSRPLPRLWLSTVRCVRGSRSYAPLRGRALAGASGARDARIFTTRFEAELVSIAGIYRTFEAGIPDQLASQSAQIKLIETQGGTDSRLSIEALKTN